MHETQVKPHLQCGTDPMVRHDPRMIRPHTRPSRTRRTAEVDHRGSGTDFVWKNIGFRASAISQKRISCETSFKTPSGNSSTSTTCNPIYSEGTISRVANSFNVTNSFPRLTLSLTNSFTWLILFTLRERSFFDRSFDHTLTNCFVFRLTVAPFEGRLFLWLTLSGTTLYGKLYSFPANCYLSLTHFVTRLFPPLTLSLTNSFHWLTVSLLVSFTVRELTLSLTNSFFD